MAMIPVVVFCTAEDLCLDELNRTQLLIENIDSDVRDRNVNFDSIQSNMQTGSTSLLAHTN